MPRLAVVGPSWPLRGGIARTTTALARALATDGELAALLTPHRQYPRWLYPGRHDIDPQACPRLDIAERCFAVLEPWSWPGLRHRLVEASPSVVVLPYWTWAWAPVSLRLASWRVAPIVMVVHNPADHDAGTLAHRVGRSVLAKANGFLCHAGSVATVLQECFPQRPVAIHALPAEASALPDRRDARASLGIPDRAVAFLCFGLIRPYKGVDVLLDALTRLPEGSPVAILLAGEPWAGEGERLQRLLASPVVARRVIAALRWIPEREVGTWFAAADAAVLPYRQATGSAVAAQALGAGLPVVASAAGGLAEVVQDGVNGVHVPAGDPAALAAALESLCDPALRARLADAARTSARSSGWTSYAATLQGVAAAVLAARGRPS
ncbi:MAG: glycosyltransferase family 4 protein [Acidobacteriota bacterium]